MNNLLYLQEKLEEQFNTKTVLIEAPTSWGVNFVLRNSKTGLPLGAFLLCDNLTQAKQEWKRLYKEMVYVSVYAINASLWINKGIVEISKWSNAPIRFEIYKEAPVIIPEAVEAPVKPLEPATDFPITLTEWKAPNGQVRLYVNGNGYGKEKETNFNSLYTQPTPGKLWVQNGELVGQLNNLKESAKVYIMGLVNSV